MKTKGWVIFFSAVLLACTAYILFQPKSSSSVAGIYKDGELIQKIDVSNVTEAYTIDLDGKNTVLVAPNSISMCDAKCPDGVCVAHGPLKKGGTPIICLPNKVVIKWIDAENEEYDAIAGAK